MSNTIRWMRRTKNRCVRFFKILFNVEHNKDDPGSCGNLSYRYSEYQALMYKLALSGRDILEPTCIDKRNHLTDYQFSCKRLCDLRDDLRCKK